MGHFLLARTHTLSTLLSGIGNGPGLRKRLNNRGTSAPDPGAVLLLYRQASWEIRERSVGLLSSCQNTGKRSANPCPLWECLKVFPKHHWESLRKRIVFSGTKHWIPPFTRCVAFKAEKGIYTSVAYLQYLFIIHSEQLGSYRNPSYVHMYIQISGPQPLQHKPNTFYGWESVWLKSLCLIKNVCIFLHATLVLQSKDK